MASLYVTEYSGVLEGSVPIAMTPGLTTQKITISGVSAQSAPFSANTSVVRIHTDAICSFVFGTNPTATASAKRLPADATEYFGVRPGDVVAVITNT